MAAAKARLDLLQDDEHAELARVISAVGASLLDARALTAIAIARKNWLPPANRAVMQSSSSAQG